MKSILEKLKVAYGRSKGAKDWRLRAKSYVKEDSKEYKKGTPFHVISVSKIPNGDYFIFSEPSATLLFLAQSIKEATIAAKNKKRFKSRKSTFSGQMAEEIHHKFDKYFFDYVQHTMVSIVTAFQALEYFCNDIIHSAQLRNFPIPKKNKTEPMHSEDIERNCDIKTKLDIVIPHIKKKKSFKGTKLWEKLRDLVDLRDRLVHLKGEEVTNNQKPVELRSSIFYELLSFSCKTYIMNIVEIITYFDENFPQSDAYKQISYKTRLLK